MSKIYDFYTGQGDVKTLQGWYHSTAECVMEYLDAGDLVDEELVMHLVNIQQPRNYRNGYFQCGGMVDERYDEKGRAKPTYLTFIRQSMDTWLYVGECFAGKKTVAAGEKTAVYAV